MSAKEYWAELNKMYGLDMEMPEELEADNFSMGDVEYEMAMGKSFDGAMQSKMEV